MNDHTVRKRAKKRPNPITPLIVKWKIHSSSENGGSPTRKPVEKSNTIQPCFFSWKYTEPADEPHLYKHHRLCDSRGRRYSAPLETLERSHSEIFEKSSMLQQPPAKRPKSEPKLDLCASTSTICPSSVENSIKSEQLRIQTLLNHYIPASNQCNDLNNPSSSLNSFQKRRYSLSDIFSPNLDLAQYVLDKTRLATSVNNHCSASHSQPSFSCQNLPYHSSSVLRSIPSWLHSSSTIPTTVLNNSTFTLPPISTISLPDPSAVSSSTLSSMMPNVADTQTNNNNTQEILLTTTTTTKPTESKTLKLESVESRTQKSVAGSNPTLRTKLHPTISTPFSQSRRSSAFTTLHRESLRSVESPHEPLTLLASLCTAQSNSY